MGGKTNIVANRNFVLYSNSNSIFISLNPLLKTGSRRTKLKKQKTITISLGHSKGQHQGEKWEKEKLRVDILVQRDRF